MAFVPHLQGSWLRNVHSGGEMRLLGLGARRLNEQCIVAGHCNASYEIQELLEVQLPITVHIKPLHHPVHNSRVLLILQETKGRDQCLPGEKGTSRYGPATAVFDKRSSINLGQCWSACALLVEVRAFPSALWHRHRFFTALGASWPGFHSPL